MSSDTDQIRGDRVRGVPRMADPGASFILDQGSITGVSRMGRYKTFGVTFGARPFVTVSSLRGAGVTGSAKAVLQGTPNVGSFRAQLDIATGGSVMTFYQATGAR